MRILTGKMIWQARRVPSPWNISYPLFMWTRVTYFFGKMTYETPLRFLLNPAIRPSSSPHLGSSTSLAGCSFCLLKIRRCWQSSFPSKILKLSWVMQHKSHLQKFMLWFSYFLITITLTQLHLFTFMTTFWICPSYIGIFLKFKHPTLSSPTLVFLTPLFSAYRSPSFSTSLL